MFRALLCSSSGGQNCIIQHLVSSHSVGGRPVHRLREDWLESRICAFGIKNLCIKLVNLRCTVRKTSRNYRQTGHVHYIHIEVTTAFYMFKFS